jgi:nucleoporin POM152
MTVKFTPPSGSSKKRWTKDFTTPPNKAAMDIAVGDAGEYSITRVQGKICEGDVMSPETCTVVEQPLPSADINFKTIHECDLDIIWCKC